MMSDCEGDAYECSMFSMFNRCGWVLFDPECWLMSVFIVPLHDDLKNNYFKKT